ncbi:MAG: hypothetical protein CMA68_00970 [Euryarchaeota archaeon]|jgi:hypothetical protein|nr:hypothetical protein [Euryarchaeota archaeon]|tara:strand:+ start:6292 stop:8094 length:1803 start_codon:yes stop_codon:yes gene_type:complete
MGSIVKRSRNITMGDIPEWSELTVSELKKELKSRGLPVSGNKNELVERLSGPGVLEAEIAGDSDGHNSSGMFEKILYYNSPTNVRNRIRRIKELPVPVLAVTAILIIGGTSGALVYGDDIIEWVQGEPDYTLIDFDQNQVRGYAQTLVDLGHPDWEGRMSGTVEEQNAAESVKNNFTSSGIPTTMDDFEVPMFVIGSEPSLSICIPGDIGNLIGGPTPCSSADVNRDITEFTHREEFVIQGYSGSASIGHVEDMDIIDLGNGSTDSDWSSAASKVAMIWLEEGTEGNTALLQRAIENDVYSMIIINARQNCDDLVSNDCVPYFKSVDRSQFEFIPDSFGFIMVSKSVGETITEMVINGDGRLGMMTDVDNQGMATIHVPCGVIQGESDSVIVLGAHHDTVYNGPGAVDDTSGVATLQEIARQFAILESQIGQPSHTLYFCTWGGEEEGLWGSKEWVDKYRTMLGENLRLYVNLDMNHVDAERNSGLTMFGNSEGDVEALRGIHGIFSNAYPELASKYKVEIRDIESSDMPYNSDHAPFVYEIDNVPGDGMDYGDAIVCYGSGSYEYHTFLDGMDRFNEESLVVSGVILGSLVRYLSYGEA